MKRISLYLLITIIGVFSALATNNVKDSLLKSNLPARARLFLKSDFDHLKLVSITSHEETNNFIVLTEDGMRFEFDKEGLWVDIDCKTNTVPSFIIPAKIKHSLGSDSKIVHIRRYGKKRFEVRLANSNSIHFDKKFRMIANNK